MAYGQLGEGETSGFDSSTAPSEPTRRWPGHRIFAGRRRTSLGARVRLACLLGLVLALFAPCERVIPSLRSFLLGGSVAGSVSWVKPSGRESGTDAGADLKNRTGPDAAGSSSASVLRGHIVAALNRQSAALRANDLSGFLAVVAPDARQLRDDLGRRFASLRAMRVATWDPSLAAGVVETGAGRWSAPVRLRYCFVVAGCVAATVTVETSWLYREGQVLLVEFATSTANQTGPRPWEVSELQAVVGSRVLVAGTSRWTSRLTGVLAAAERAAAVADRYSRWDDPPGRYVVYVAGPEEWASWYGVSQASWVAGYAIALTDTYREVVLNATKVGSLDVREVLQHEFTHVVTLSGVHATYPNTWWLVEGIAEYAQNLSRPLAEYRALIDGRRYVYRGWNGSIALPEPGPSVSLSEANGRYAVVYLALRLLVERYGEERVLRFFAAVVRNGVRLERAARSTLGQSWALVSGECTSYIRIYLGSFRGLGSDEIP